MLLMLKCLGILWALLKIEVRLEKRSKVTGLLDTGAKVNVMTR